MLFRSEPDAIYDLNPELIQQMTPPDREWEVRLPAGSSDTFAANWGASTADKPAG